MSTTLFPIIQPQIEEVPTLSMYKEVKWDYENNTPIFHNGEPVLVTGKEAVKVWAWKALHTPRYRYEVYTWDYGCELESLIGGSFTDELKQSEAARYIRDCLLVNPYIINVNNTTVSFDGDKISIKCIAETIYGEVKIDV